MNIPKSILFSRDNIICIILTIILIGVIVLGLLIVTSAADHISTIEVSNTRDDMSGSAMIRSHTALYHDYNYGIFQNHGFGHVQSRVASLGGAMTHEARSRHDRATSSLDLKNVRPGLAWSSSYVHADRMQLLLCDLHLDHARGYYRTVALGGYGSHIMQDAISSHHVGAGIDATLAGPGAYVQQYYSNERNKIMKYNSIDDNERDSLIRAFDLYYSESVGQLIKSSIGVYYE